MKKLILIAVLFLSGVSVAHAQNIIGDWQGTLKTAGGDLHLALHISEAKDGGYQGTLDSLDQNANGIPLSAIALKKSALTVDVPSVHGSYAGKVNADSNEIDGTWTQGADLPLNFTRVAAATSKPQPEPDHARPSDLDGDWSGTLDAGSAQFHLIFHIVNTSAGLTATLDSPDQHAMDIPVTTVTRHDSDLKMELKQLDAFYEGAINAGRTGIKGTWTQVDRSFPLVLTRGNPAAAAAQPKP